MMHPVWFCWCGTEANVFGRCPLNHDLAPLKGEKRVVHEPLVPVKRDKAGRIVTPKKARTK